MKSRRSFLEKFVASTKYGAGGAIIGAIPGAVYGRHGGVIPSIIFFFLLFFIYKFILLSFGGKLLKRRNYAVGVGIRFIIWFVVLIFSFIPFIFFAMWWDGLLTTEFFNSENLEYDLGKEFKTLELYEIIVILIAVVSIEQINELLGKGVLLNYILGRYHKPRKEERIFMFIDLSNSTKLAETLGSLKYSAFLQDFFTDIDDAIVNNDGRVLQYVGDEVVIVWNTKKGLANNCCLQAFFEAEKAIALRKEEYLKKYDDYPKFKASAHIGNVTIAEIGQSKKEIAHHGDTINTASRILSMCHQLNSTFLISDDLYSRLVLDSTDILSNFEGEFSLKGREKKMKLYSLSSESI